MAKKENIKSIGLIVLGIIGVIGLIFLIRYANKKDTEHVTETARRSCPVGTIASGPQCIPIQKLDRGAE